MVDSLQIHTKPPLPEAEIGQMLLEALACELRALTLAQLLTAGHVGVESDIIAKVEAAQARADALVQGSYTNEPLDAPEAAS